MQLKNDDLAYITHALDEKILTLEELAIIYHKTPAQIGKAASNYRYGLRKETSSPRRKLSQAQIDEMIEDKVEYKMSTKLIAEKFGVSVQTVQRYLRKKKESPTARSRLGTLPPRF